MLTNHQNFIMDSIHWTLTFPNHTESQICFNVISFDKTLSSHNTSICNEEKYEEKKNLESSVHIEYVNNFDYFNK